MKSNLINTLFVACISVFAVTAKANTHYTCDLNGTKSEPGEKVSIYLENELPVLMECKLVLKTMFLGEAKYKVYVEKAEWVQFFNGQPLRGILPINENK